MGMLVEMKQGESLVAYVKDSPNVRVTITMEQKLGDRKARLRFDAEREIVLVPPNRQRVPG